MKPRLVERARAAQPDRQPAAPHYLNRSWQYHPSTTHADSQAFRERMAARMAAAQPNRRK